MTDGQKSTGVVRKHTERSFVPSTAEEMRRRMTMRTSRELQHVMARIEKAAKNNCKRIRVQSISSEAREFLVDELGYVVTLIVEKDKYEVRWAGHVDDTEEEDTVEIDPAFAEG